MTDDTSPERRRAPRRAINGEVEFVLDGAIMEAQAVDISEAGVAFEVEQAPTLTLYVRVEGEELLRRARLVRLFQTDDGRYRLGLEFLDSGASEAPDEG